MSEVFNHVILELFDNIEDGKTCCTCKAFNGAWIYCPIFNHILKDEDITRFDETGERNRCELYLSA